MELCCRPQKIILKEKIRNNRRNKFQILGKNYCCNNTDTQRHLSCCLLCRHCPWRLFRSSRTKNRIKKNLYNTAISILFIYLNLPVAYLFEYLSLISKRGISEVERIIIPKKGFTRVSFFPVDVLSLLNCYLVENISIL